MLNAWIDTWEMYLRFEETFDSTKLKEYKRGEIIHIHLGYNVGREEGGSRFAVVMDNKNSVDSDIITIVPISSLDKGQTKDDLHWSEVYLGKVIPKSDIESYALPTQIRCISKIRIIKPKNTKHITYKLDSDKLTEIDNVIKLLFAKIPAKIVDKSENI